MQAGRRCGKILALGLLRGKALQRVARRLHQSSKVLAAGLLLRLGTLGDAAFAPPAQHSGGVLRPPGMGGLPMMPGTSRKKMVRKIEEHVFQEAMTCR